MTQVEIMNKQANGLYASLSKPDSDRGVGDCVNKINFYSCMFKKYKYEDRRKANDYLCKIKSLIEGNKKFSHMLLHIFGIITSIDIKRGNVWIYSNEKVMCVRKDECRHTEAIAKRMSFYSTRELDEFADCKKCPELNGK